jgi:diketogulonate reductase-like aldo/keto reductase
MLLTALRLVLALFNPAHFAFAAVNIPTIKLHDSTQIPGLGLGVYRTTPGTETYNAVKWALELGYRMVDTAQMYDNEASVGQAVTDSGIPREELWIQSKLHHDNHGYQQTIDSVKQSMEKMGLTYLDCFLVHSPYGDKLVETWDALIKLKKDGLLRSVGVSNYAKRHIEALVSHGRPLPTLNQIEMHPMILDERQDLVKYCEEKGIIVQAYGSMFFGKTEFLSHQHVIDIVKNHPGKTEAQVLLRWGWQKGFQLIPKSVRKHRIEENMNIFDFALTGDEMASLDEMRGQLGAYWNPVNDARVNLGETEKYREDL